MKTRIKYEQFPEPIVEELTLFGEKDACLSLLGVLKRSQKTLAWKSLISMAEYVLDIDNRNKYLIIENVLKEALSLGPKAVLMRETENAARFHKLCGS